MANSIGIDSLLGEGTMPAAYSADIRGRVIASVESGSSRREAAEEFDVSASSAIKWVAAYRTTGSCAAKPRGGSTSPLEKYATFLRTLIEGQPDLTLDEVVCAMRKRKLPGSRTAVWRFFQRHSIRAYPHYPRSFQLFQACRLCVKSTGICSNLGVALSGGGIFAFFCSERDHKPQNSGWGYTA